MTYPVAWEYLWHPLYVDDRAEEKARHLANLNALGAQGWEFTGFYGRSGGLFKRPAAPGSPDAEA